MAAALLCRVPAGAGRAAYVALKVRESEVWQRTHHQSWRSLWKGLESNWKLLCYITLFTMTLHMSSHGSQDMYPTFLERQWGIGPGQRALLTACSMVGALAVEFYAAFFRTGGGGAG
jgi:SHS family lactate transporter-like MFS transporter